MSYEFAPPEQTTGNVKAPEFWLLRQINHLYEIGDFDPRLARYNSIVQHSTSDEIAIDVNDTPFETHQYQRFGDRKPIGVMKVFVLSEQTDGEAIKGYIVDLRYKTSLVKREWKVDDANGAEPVLGITFLDPVSGLIHFETPYNNHSGYYEQLKRYSEDLIAFVDNERRSRKEIVIGEEPQKSTDQPADVLTDGSEN